MQVSQGSGIESPSVSVRIPGVTSVTVREKWESKGAATRISRVAPPGTGTTIEGPDPTSRHWRTLSEHPANVSTNIGPTRVPRSSWSTRSQGSGFV